MQELAGFRLFTAPSTFDHISNADLVAQNHRYVIRIDGINKDALDQIGNYIDPEAAYPVIVTE